MTALYNYVHSFVFIYIIVIDYFNQITSCFFGFPCPSRITTDNFIIK